MGAQSDIHHPSVFRFAIGQSVMGWCSQGCQGIVDTGTSLLTVPNQVFTELMQYIGAQADDSGQVGRVGWETRGERQGMHLSRVGSCC